jgi:hypothetical protein
MRSRSPCVATDSTVPSAAHKITRRAITASGTATGVSEMTTSTATIAIITHADSHSCWNNAVQISGTRMTIPTPDVVPAARIRHSTEPV